MTAGQVIAAVSGALPQPVADDVLLSFLQGEENKISRAMATNRRSQTLIATGGVAPLPDYIHPHRIYRVVHTGGDVGYLAAPGVLQVPCNGSIGVVYAPLVPPLTQSSCLLAGEEGAQLYFYSLMASSCLLLGDIAGYNNYTTLYQQQYQTLCRQWAGAAAGGRQPWGVKLC